MNSLPAIGSGAPSSMAALPLRPPLVHSGATIPSTAAEMYPAAVLDVSGHNTIASAKSSATNAITNTGDLKREAAVSSQDHTQAYEAYARAWGGRVVHGEVELPPFSLYAD